MRSAPGLAVKLSVMLVLTYVSALASFAVHADDGRWMQLKTAFFADAEIHANDDVIVLETPARAYDAAVVPVVVRVTNQYKNAVLDGNANAATIKKIHLIVDQNPLPLAGVFKFNQSIALWDTLETNIRINEYTDVRAIAEMTDGTLHMSSRFVKASGGCSAPAMADLEAAVAKAGQLDILVGEINAAPGGVAAGSGVETVLSISHPNNSGMQFDQVSRNYIPAFFITEIGLKSKDDLLLDVETNFSLSENPIVKISFSDNYEYKNLVLYAIDSKGNRFEKEIALERGRATLETNQSG